MKCSGKTKSGEGCQRTTTGKWCYQHQPTTLKKQKIDAKSTLGAREAYDKLENDIWSNTYSGNVTSGLTIIKNFVKEVYNTHTPAWLEKEIRKAPDVKVIKVYDYQPGTGNGSRQFYKFAKAIEKGKINEYNFDLDKMKLLIKNYVFDQIE